MRPRTGPLRALGVLALGVALLAGCGGSARREHLDDYVSSVNDAQADLRADIGRINRDYALLARGEFAKSLPRLRAAEVRVREARRRTAALTPPEDARRLHRLVLGLLDRQVALAHEATLLAGYQPPLVDAFTAFERAERRVRRELGDAKTASAQAAAFSAFAAATARARARLTVLRPPPMLSAARADQVARLAAVATLARRIAATLHGGDRSALAVLVARYGRLVRDAQTPAQQRARAAAIRSYNSRVRGLRVQAARVETERKRLERKLNG